MTTALASAGDSRYGKWLVNLVGSVQANSDLVDRIVVYDLGLTPFQRRLLEQARGVEVRAVPAFVPHWRQGRTWKTWIWKNLEADTIVWLDAGVTVLRPMTEFLIQTRERGYFVVSTKVSNDRTTPTDYYSLYPLPPDFSARLAVTAGILAFARSSPFFRKVIEPTFDDAVAGRNLGFSKSEVAKLNWGLDRLEEVIVRDCPLFRHEQTLLNIHFYTAIRDPHVNDLDKYAGFTSPHDHPEQVVWNHRRRGDYRFLPRVRYKPRTAPLGIVWGTAVYAQHQARAHSWLLRPRLYATLVCRLVMTGRLQSPRSTRPPSSPS